MTNTVFSFCNIFKGSWLTNTDCVPCMYRSKVLRYPFKGSWLTNSDCVSYMFRSKVLRYPF